MSDPVASEKAAELAKSEKIDLASIKGTGAEGLVKVGDVRDAVAKRKAEEDAAAAAAASTSAETESAAAPANPDPPPPKKTAGSSPMRERSHVEGCPMNPDRVETYTAVVPPKRRSDGFIEHPAREATMAHCVDCGATVEV